MLRQLSIVLRDWVRFELLPVPDRHLRICNRAEKISQGPFGRGYVCLWPYTSRLAAPAVWPYLGKRLLRIQVAKNKFIKSATREVEASIEVSVLIGHRGIERLPHLIATLQSLASQRGVSMECIVIEQDIEPKIDKLLPSWVRYVFMEIESNEVGYNRSAAFNYGANYAKGRVLLLHDNDMIVHTDYCTEIVRIADLGYEAINIKRYVFYLTKNHSDNVTMSFELIGSEAPEYVVQNLEAGGSVAITTEGFKKIGGMDERFTGWGGEDNEFWDRCNSLRKWIWGFAPVIHLWHTSQPLKDQRDNPNIQRARELVELPREIRIKELTRINAGVTYSGNRDSI